MAGRRRTLQRARRRGGLGALIGVAAEKEGREMPKIELFNFRGLKGFPCGKRARVICAMGRKFIGQKIAEGVTTWAGIIMGRTGYAGLYNSFSPLFYFLCKIFCSHLVVLLPPEPNAAESRKTRSHNHRQMNFQIGVLTPYLDLASATMKVGRTH